MYLQLSSFLVSQFTVYTTAWVNVSRKQNYYERRKSSQSLVGIQI